jgi:hypothetical protein
MKLRSLIFVVLLVTPVAALAANPSIVRLPSGKEVKVLGIGKWFFTKSKVTALMLRYETKLNIDNVELLRQEAEEIWPIFRVNAEKSGLSTAIISANEIQKKNILGVSHYSSYNFVISKTDFGPWKFSDSWKRNYDLEAQRIAQNYFSLSSKERYDDAAHLFKYPDSYSPQELNKDAESVANILRIISEEVGVIQTYNLSDKEKPDFHVGLFGGLPEYWEKHPYFIKLIYDVVFSKKGGGQVVFLFSLVDNKLVINSVLHGLTPNTMKNQETVEGILNRAQKEIKP